MEISLATITKGCKKFWEKVFEEDGLVNNPDGTISVFLPNSNGIKSPATVSKQCCDILSTINQGLYYYDLDAQKCRWSDQSMGCVDEKPFKVVLNPKGNDGSIFYFDNNEKCSLLVDFDYLFKFDCQTLNDSLIQITPIDPVLALEIQNLQDSISEQIVICEEIQSNLEYLMTEFDNAYYSIECENFPMGQIIVDPIILPETNTGITPAQIAPFTNTGFGGGLSPFAFPQMLYGYASFCLTEQGLNVWEDILGPNKYQDFLNADTSSYTCGDVINIFTQNEILLGEPINTEPLIITCETPFGFKTNIKYEIDLAVIQQTECQNTLIDLQTQLEILETQQNSIIGNCNNPISIMETLDVSMSIELVNDDGTLSAVTTNQFFPAIGNGNLYEYLVSHPTDSGFFICGEANPNETWTSGCTGLIYPELSPQTKAETYINEVTNVSSCIQIKDYILQALFNQSQLLSETTFKESLAPTIMSSNWLHNQTLIDNEEIINLIANKKIKISLNVNSSCGDFCVLIDNISLTKQCASIKKSNMFVSQSPGFYLERVVDNKKSWLNNSSFENRDFIINDNKTIESIRQTNYGVFDDRLVINSKEIDLNINMAAAVEYDVWQFLSDNPCLLTGTTNCDVCPCENISNESPCEKINVVYKLPNSDEVYLELTQDGIQNGLFTYSFDVNLEGYGDLTIKLFSNTSEWYLYNEYYDTYFGVLYSSIECPFGDYVVFGEFESFSASPLNGVIINDNKTYQDNECFVFQDEYLYEFMDSTLEENIFSVCCGDNKLDFKGLLTTDLSNIKTIESFENTMISELINVKNRQTISSYPTLRGLYERYLNSSGFCSTNSSEFDYYTMDQFAGLIGNYWVDLIEQVIPSTTIWGSVKIYTNTIFDQQKFKYKQYSTLIGENPFQGISLLSPINETNGKCQDVEVITTVINSPKEGELTPTPIYNVSNSICISQMNWGSEFIGTVKEING